MKVQNSKAVLLRSRRREVLRISARKQIEADAMDPHTSINHVRVAIPVPVSGNWVFDFHYA